MDLPVTRETIRASEPVFDTVSDHPVDCDIILPDYCPDIARILKTEAEASIDSKTIESGRLNINGTFSVRIIYIPESSRRIRCVSHETPFSHSFDLKDPEEKVHTKANVRVAFANCRPIGPRRLQIRASLSVSARMWREKEETFITGCEDERVELLKKKLLASTVVGMAERPFQVHEELEIGYGKPAASAVIKASAVAVVQDYKLISNKVIAKGELLIRTLYSPETDDEESAALETMDYSLPLSQIIDLEGVDEDCGCDVRFSTGVIHAEPKADSDGENRLLDVDVTVTAVARAYRTQEVLAVSDAYSPQFEMQNRVRELSFEHMSEHIHSTEVIRQTVEFENMQIAAIIDSSVKLAVTGTKIEASGMEITGDMSFSILASDSDGGPVSIEKAMPFTLNLETKSGGGSVYADPELSVVSTGFSLAGAGRIDMRVECAVEASIYASVKEDIISEMSLDEEHPRESGKRSTLTLYYADRGEKIWDIAKRYCTSMEAIKRENNLEEDSLGERSMLLIPRKRPARK